MGDHPERPSWQPVQLRIGFTAPTAPCSMTLTLEGLQVAVDAGDAELAAGYLSAAGVTVDIDADRGVRFAVRDLTSLRELPDQVSVHAVGGLASLLEAVVNPPLHDTTLTVTMDGPTTLNLSWYDDVRRFDEPLPLALAPALVASGIAFVAAPDTWERVLEASRLPLVVGRARVNLDGFVEILASAPQKIEAAPLPALFRVDATHYGLPLALAPVIDSATGFVWDGPRPVGDRAPRKLAEPSLPLSEHARSDLRMFVEALATERARAVVWPAGMGRRVFCFAGVESLGAFPLLVVCGADAVWSWQRNASLFGRSVSMDHDRDDVRIMTYEELTRNPRVSSPAAIIFDDLDQALARDPSLLDHLRRFDGIIDVVRVSCSQDFPSDIGDQVRMMSLIRPGEFRSDTPIALRYPVAPERRAGEHVAVYLMRREKEASQPGFSRSTVEVLQAGKDLGLAFSEVRSGSGSFEEKVDILVGLASHGSSLAVSPKLARSVEHARAAFAAGRSIALVTRHARTTTMLRALVRPLPVHDFDPTAAPMSGVTIVRADLITGDLRSYDEVVFIDYPWSTSQIDALVGEAGAVRAPSRVTVLHLAGSIDDRAAVVAAKRRERASVLDQTSPPSAVELRWMLAF